MGRVYKVRNIISDRIEAMKVLAADLDRDQELSDRFIREIRVHATLDHPNIAKMYTAVRWSGRLLLLMEYLEGTTLETLLRRGPISLRDCVGYSVQTLAALSYAHSRGVVHRDIKPANLMLTSRGAVKLMDFGIAKASVQQGLTQTGLTVGSLPYMSPEQIQGETQLDARSDIYSFGIALYELATGQRPFRAESQYTLMSAHLKEAPEPPAAVNPSLPPALSEIILTAIAKDPADRFQSAEALRNAILDLSAEGAATRAKPAPEAGGLGATKVRAAGRAQLPTETVLAARPPKPSRRYLVAGALAAIAALAVAAVLVLPRWTGKNAPEEATVSAGSAPGEPETGAPGGGEPQPIEPGGTGAEVAREISERAPAGRPSAAAKPAGASSSQRETRPLESARQAEAPASGLAEPAGATDAAASIWLIPVSGRNAEPAHRLFARPRIAVEPRFCPDGMRIAFVSVQNGEPRIWLSTIDGAAPTPLTDLPGASAQWSPDGRQIAFVSGASGQRSICVIGAGGGEPVRISGNAMNPRSPTWSRDGAWVYFGAEQNGECQVWKAPARGGELVQVTQNGGAEAWEAADGASLLFVKPRPQLGIYGQPRGGGERLLMRAGFESGWIVRNDGIYLLARVGTEAPVVLHAPGLRSRPAVVAELPGPVARRRPGFSVSPDGRWLAVAIERKSQP